MGPRIGRVGTSRTGRSRTPTHRPAPRIRKGSCRMTLPDPYKDIGYIMSNLDHSIDTDLAEQLMADSTVCAGHSASMHYGYVWFEEDRWHEQVWQYGAPLGVYSADTLQGLMDTVNIRYGWT